MRETETGGHERKNRLTREEYCHTRSLNSTIFIFYLMSMVRAGRVWVDHDTALISTRIDSRVVEL